MRKALWMVIVLVLALWGSGAALAQSLDDCSIQCTSESSCSASCLYDDDPYTEENDAWITCGQYGVCDADPDDDFVYGNDNCPYTYNPDQGDCDGDSIGNVCDSQNATWQPAEALHTCHIYDRRHVGSVDVTMVSEQLQIDVSNCYGGPYGGSGIRWLRWEIRGVCYGLWPEEWDCCVSFFGFSQCVNYFGRNSCATG